MGSGQGMGLGGRGDPTPSHSGRHSLASPGTLEPSSTRVLVIGYRAGLARALRRQSVPYAIWHDRPVRTSGRELGKHIHPFGNSKETSRQNAKALADLGPFTHVIAGTEAAVVAASHARRTLGARRSVHTTVMRCHDKLAMKRWLQRHDIPMTPFLDVKDAADPAELIDKLGSPLVVKDRKGSGGRGIDFLESAEEVTAVGTRNRYAESFVDGPEVSVESFVNGGHILFENITEYVEKTHVNVVPGGLPDDERDAILDLSRRVVAALRINWGMTHLELYRTSEGPLFGEIALRPPGGYIMELLRLAYGFDAWRALVSVELDLPLVLPTGPKRHAAAIVLHPGAGEVQRIDGVEAVKAMTEVRRIRLKIDRGATVAMRRGVGEDTGHVLLQAPTRPLLFAALDRVRELLVIDMGGTGGLEEPESEKP